MPWLLVQCLFMYKCLSNIVFTWCKPECDLYIATLRQNVCHSVLGGVLRLKFVETGTVILSPLLKKRLFNCTFCFVLFVDSLVACKITKGYFQ